MKQKEVLVKPEQLKKIIINQETPKNIKISTANLNSFFDDIAHHFKTDKWPLSSDSLRSDLFMKMTGLDDVMLIARELIKRGVQVGYGNFEFGSGFFVKKQKAKAKKKVTKKKASKKK